MHQPWEDHSWIGTKSAGLSVNKAVISLPRMSSTPPVPVVCAILDDGRGRMLIAQRPAHKHLGLKWEFPGGKVEAGESPERALVREIAEELGCDIAIGRALPCFTHDYGTVRIAMIPFLCSLAPGSPAPHAHEHVALRWVTPAELRDVDLAPADVPIVAWL